MKFIIKLYQTVSSVRYLFLLFFFFFEKSIKCSNLNLYNFNLTFLKVLKGSDSFPAFLKSTFTSYPWSKYCSYTLQYYLLPNDITVILYRLCIQYQAYALYQLSYIYAKHLQSGILDVPSAQTLYIIELIKS